MSFRLCADDQEHRIYTSRNSEWVLDSLEVDHGIEIYTSRNSEWVLDLIIGNHTVIIYTSRNSEWVLDPTVNIYAYTSTLVEILNEF